MGLLFDKDFWAARANEVFAHRPMPGQTMPDGDAQAVLSIACRALTDLTSDSELSTDLELARSIAVVDRSIIRKNTPFEKFLDEFIKAERNILNNSGVKIDAAEELLREVQNLSNYVDNIQVTFDRLPEKINVCKKLSCEFAKSLAKQKEGEIIVRDVKRGLFEVILIGIDASSAIAAGPASVISFGPAAASVSAGAALIHDAVKGRW